MRAEADAAIGRGSKRTRMTPKCLTHPSGEQWYHSCTSATLEEN